MAIRLIKEKGNLFDFPGEVICNAVNCEGKMAGGIAAQFAQKFRDMNIDYKQNCLHNFVAIGKCGYHEISDSSWKVIANIPTMEFAGSEASIADICKSLDDFFYYVTEEKIRSVVMPYLGCGVGGLAPQIFEQILETYKLKHDVTIILVEYCPPKSPFEG